MPQTLDTACLDVIIDLSTTPSRISIVTNAIEAPRLRDTELAGLDSEWAVIPWWASRDDQLPRGAGVGSDRPLSGSAPLADDLSALRRPLTGLQRHLLHEVCRDSAVAATAAAQSLTPVMTEYQAAAVLAKELLTRELDPIVLMVGGQARLQAHRHPLPTSKPLGRRAMLVACGRRHGLVSSITRIVSFDPLTSAEEDAYRRLLHVEETFLDVSVVGASIGAAFTAGITAYAAQGFDPAEWHRH
ncbi:M24 family metallopeptidase, partial [Lapillicoccus sp.]|uniref:M24 family metallopeptidase n=1 Tax=Lapillicoccus sp. TaxID=1909287 RepID=UPI003263CA62